MSAVALAPARHTTPVNVHAGSPAPLNPYTRPRRVLGDPTPLACTVAKTALEALLGGPGVDQLARWITPTIRRGLAEQAGLAQRAGLSLAHPVRIQRIRLYRASEVAAEAAIVAHDGTRARAIAARLEDVGGRWQVTALDVG